MDVPALSDLIRRGETRNVEIKSACGFEGDMRAHLANSIGCLVNTPGGGTIMLGVENNTGVVKGLTREQLASFDPTKIANYLKSRLTPTPRFTTEQISHPDGVILLLQIPEFDDVPVMVVKQIEDSARNVYAREGDLLIRSETRECRRINSADEMRELIGRALSRRQETLLTQIRAIMQGATIPQPLFLPEEAFATALPEWDTTLAAWKKQRPKCAWWEVNLLPVPIALKPLEPAQLVEFIRQHAVKWSGWYYPTYGVKDQQVAFTQHYVQFAYESKRDSERWQAAYDGSFGSAHIVRGDTLAESDPQTFPPIRDHIIDYVDICHSLTEFFRFATSLAEGLACEALWVKITLHNVKGRPLGALDSQYDFLGPRDVASIADVAQAQTFSAVDLASAWRERALDWTKTILTVFQWPEASREKLAAHQERLIKRRVG